MKVVLIFACLLSPVFGRAVVTERTITPEVLGNKTFKACGPRLNDVYKLICELAQDVDISTLLSRSKRGVVDECCHHSCLFKEFAEYCPGKANFNGLLMANELRVTTQATKIARPTTARQPTNEVRKNGRSKARRDGRWRRQPIVMPCMYRSYAHFLLRGRRRLQGKIKKKERTMSDAQHGTTGPVRVCETCSAPQYQT